eukprot:365632-Chlamydomonas_euryale.AAC.33
MIRSDAVHLTRKNACNVGTFLEAIGRHMCLGMMHLDQDGLAALDSVDVLVHPRRHGPAGGNVRGLDAAHHLRVGAATKGCRLCGPRSIALVAP